jgi:hypothetical protein
MATTRTNDSKVDGEAHSNGSSLERITVNLTKKSTSALTQVTNLTGDTKTEVLNKALQFYGQIKEFLDSGGALYMRDTGSNELERIKIF